MQPPTFNPGYNPQAPVAQNPPLPAQQQFAAPQPYPPSPGNLPPMQTPSPYQSFPPGPSTNKPSGGNPFTNFKNKVSGFGVGTFLSIVFVALLVSSTSTYFIMGGTLFSSENPDEFVGKWYTPRDDGHIQMKEDGTLLEWNQPRFVCLSGGETVPARYVNDGDEDCEDGSDEGTKRANSFDKSYQWIEISESSDLGVQSTAEWSYVDDELCFQIEQSKSSLGSGKTSSCRRAEIVGDALWFIGEIFEDDFYETSEQIQCGVYLKLDRSNGPQDWDGTWVNTWNFALEDAYGSRPSFCQSTSFDRLEYDDDDDYDYYWDYYY